MVAIKNDILCRRYGQPTKIIHGPCHGEFLVAGASVGSVRASLVDAFNISGQALAFLNGEQVDWGYRLRGGERLEFVKQWGRKSVLEPEELARLERLESRLRQIEAQMPTVAALTEAVVRVADHLAPPAANIIGSRYIADRLGCTTAWVGKMAFNGMIPRKCIVPGTGKGRLWKFYRQQIDEWLATRAPNGSS